MATKIGVVAKKIVQPGNNSHLPRDGLHNYRSPMRRDLAARRRDAYQQDIGLGRLGQRADKGDPPADSEHLLTSLAGRLAIQHGHHFLRAVADQADGRLGGVWVVVPVGNYHHAA